MSRVHKTMRSGPGQPPCSVKMTNKLMVSGEVKHVCSGFSFDR